jgi:C-terminal processing protease CtpA/Prc
MSGSRILWVAAAACGVALLAQSPAGAPPVKKATENFVARPVTPKGLDNIRALARLFGFVRYFYPSDEAAATDWNRLAMVAIDAVEPAQTSAELAATLQNLFASIAPLLHVFPTGTPPPTIDLKPTRQVIMWQYHGLGLRQPFESPYTSKRVVLPAPEARSSLEPFHAELPGGVSCIMPIVLYRNASASPPESVVPSGPESLPNDRTTRLAAIVISWNVFQHFYPYFDALQTDWMASLGALLSEAAEDKDVHAFHETLQRMTVALRDGHGQIAGPGGSPNFKPPIVWTWAEGRIVALSVSSNIGIRVGDVVLAINGQPANDVLHAREALIPGSTQQCIRERALDQLMTGSRGDKLRLELEPAKPGVRYAVTVECTARSGEVRQSRPPKVKELEPGIFYVDLARLTAADYSAVVPSLEKARGIVFDMRDRPDQAVDLLTILRHLLDRTVSGPPLEIPVVTKPDRQGMTFERHQWQVTPMSPYFSGKKAFLINGWDISYAETVLGMVEHYKLADTVGEATAGTNGVINPFRLPGGFEITWTGMRVLKHDGSPLFGVGILPTIPISLTQAGIAAGRDEVLERAIKAVKE